MPWAQRSDGLGDCNPRSNGPILLVPVRRRRSDEAICEIQDVGLARVGGDGGPVGLHPGQRAVSPGEVLIRLGIGVGVLFALIVTHELGHALVGRLLGYRIFELSFGTGPPILDTVLGRTRLRLRPIPAGGHTLLAPKGARLIPAREVFVSLAGPAVNLLTLALAFATDLPTELRGVVIVMSAALVVGNLLPRQAVGPLGMAVSDGLRAARGLDTDEEGERLLLASRYLGESYVAHAKGEHEEAMRWDERGLAAFPGQASLEGDVATSMILLGRFDRRAND